jgi:ATP-dependent Clp protease protease subunit
MIHQPWGGYQGTAADIAIHAKEIINVKEKVNKILSGHTGKPLKQIEKDTDRDYFMSASESKNYGIVDAVIGKTKKNK